MNVFPKGEVVESGEGGRSVWVVEAVGGGISRDLKAAERRGRWVQRLALLGGLQKTELKMESKDGFHLQSIEIQEDDSLSLRHYNFQMEEKSGKCNLCATRCLSCPHFEQVASIAGLGTSNFTNEASKEKKSSHCSSNDGILFSHSLNSVYDCRQHTSSEASNIFSVSSCPESFSEIAESRATVRVSDPCEDTELLLDIRNAQPAGESRSRDSPKDLIKFDIERFSNQIEKHKELDTPVDNVSCISRSDSAYLRIADTHFDRADNNHCDFLNFTKKHPQEGVVYPNFIDCTISPKGEPSECSGEKVESLPARVAMSGISQIDGVYNYHTFNTDNIHLNCKHLDAGMENHLNCGGRIFEPPVIDAANLFISWYSVDFILFLTYSFVPGIEPQTYNFSIKNTCIFNCNISAASFQLPFDLYYFQLQYMGYAGVINEIKSPELHCIIVRVCDICGDVGREELLAICSKCTDGAEHIYCMRIIRDKVPEGDWACEECSLKIDTDKPVQDKVEETARISIGSLECQKSGSSLNIESRSGSKFKSRSSGVGSTRTDDVSSTFRFSAKRQGTPLKAQSAKEARTTEMNSVHLRSSKPCHNSPSDRDTSFKNLKKVEMKATKEINSELQSFSNLQDKAKVPSAFGDKRHVGTLKAELGEKRKDHELKVISPTASNKINNALLHGDTTFKRLKKGEMEASKEITSELLISSNDQKKSKVHSACGDKRHVQTLNVELNKKRRDLEAKVISPKASNTFNNSLLHRNTSFKNLKKVEKKASKEIASVVQISCNPGNIKVPGAFGDKRHVETFKADLRREPPSNLGKPQREAALSVSSLKHSSYSTPEKSELPSILGDKSPKLCSKTEISQYKCVQLNSKSSNDAGLKLKGQLAKGSLLKSRSYNAEDLKSKGQLAKGDSSEKQMVARKSDNKKQADTRVLSKSLSFNSVISDKVNATCSEVRVENADCLEGLKKLNREKEIETIKGKNMSELHSPAMCSPSCDDVFISESNCHKLDSVRSCGLSHNSSKASSSIANNLALDEESCQRNLPQFEAAIFFHSSTIPEPNYKWLGKFQLHTGEGLASVCGGVQPLVSTSASPRVLELAYKLPEIIILEALPRLETWPSQFIKHRATEENIAFYFFATDLDRTLLECMTKYDLALRGNLDGFELLIFPSNLLPEKCQRWNKILFLWGVFRGRKEKNSDNEKRPAFDLNAYPQDREDTEGVAEGGECLSVTDSLGDIHKFDSTGTRSSGDVVLLEGDGSGFTDAGQSLDKGGNKSQVVDLNLSVWPQSATHEGGLWLSTAIADNGSIEEMHHGKPRMEDGEASVSGSHEKILEAANTLVSLREGVRNI
ncbi:uncharacterized protein G2W53_019732 [Senna tora]|uniref:Zinc finger PHD-type domain-containing protein n=1 Tax=Senna tora TaxID=362788 RepID=A0A834TU58_9FABA|nr:uncharacterized protein G2W53_019732 [Senna tora]